MSFVQFENMYSPTYGLRSSVTDDNFEQSAKAYDPQVAPYDPPFESCISTDSKPVFLKASFPICVTIVVVEGFKQFTYFKLVQFLNAASPISRHFVLSVADKSEAQFTKHDGDIALNLEPNYIDFICDVSSFPVRPPFAFIVKILFEILMVLLPRVSYFFYMKYCV